MASGVVKDYRKLLRHLKGFPSATASQSEFRILVTKLRRNSEDHERSIRLLSSYVAQLTSVKELNHLRGLDSGEKMSQREKIQASARRVGLSTPLFFDHDKRELVNLS